MSLPGKFRRHVESGRQSLEPMSAGEGEIRDKELDVKLPIARKCV